jgi:hypothetical protein
MKQASVSSTDHGGGKRRAAGMDVIAPPPLGSSGLAVDGTGSASGYPPIASPSPPMSPSVRPPGVWGHRAGKRIQGLRRVNAGHAPLAAVLRLPQGCRLPNDRAVARRTALPAAGGCGRGTAVHRLDSQTRSSGVTPRITGRLDNPHTDCSLPVARRCQIC